MASRTFAAIYEFFFGPPNGTNPPAPLENCPYRQQPPMEEPRDTKNVRLFRAYDPQRKKLHTIASPPMRLRQHRVDKREWAGSATKATRMSQRRKAVKQPKRPMTAASILRYDEYEFECLECGRAGNDPKCGMHCYRKFRKTTLTGERLVELRDVGALGHGAFTKPGVTIKKDQYLDEYFGDLWPLDSDRAVGSRYVFFFPGKCILDAAEAGNWTRYVNSHCRPNLSPEPNFVGKRQVMLFKALIDIGPGEELYINYGKNYFKAAGIVCKCSACQSGERRSKRKA